LIPFPRRSFPPSSASFSFRYSIMALRRYWAAALLAACLLVTGQDLSSLPSCGVSLLIFSTFPLWCVACASSCRLSMASPPVFFYICSSEPIYCCTSSSARCICSWLCSNIAPGPPPRQIVHTGVHIHVCPDPRLTSLFLAIANMFQEHVGRISPGTGLPF
jgi:hypothetical protein